MDISAILNTEKPKDNQIMSKVNFRSAVLDIKTRIADIPRDITNRINWIVRDTILANDYSGPTRAPKFIFRDAYWEWGQKYYIEKEIE